MRDEIKKFAEEMEKTASKHDIEKTDSWKEVKIEYLEDCLIEEVREYFESNNKSELGDIGNFCWMLWNRKEESG